MSSTRPPRDPIVQDKPGTAGGGVSRSDLLNGSPRTKSVSHGGPNFSPKDQGKTSAPAPNNPYGKG